MGRAERGEDYQNSEENARKIDVFGLGVKRAVGISLERKGERGKYAVVKSMDDNKKDDAKKDENRKDDDSKDNEKDE